MPEWLVQIMATLGAGVGAYSAIRADLARLNEVATQARDAAALAHRRIDTMTERRGVTQ